MFRATVRSLLSHKLRLALTAASVVLGVAFVSGTLIFTDTLGKTFTTLFGEVDKDTAVAVRTKAAFESQTQTGTDVEPVPASILDIVAAVDGVATAYPVVDGYAAVIGPDGKVLGARGAPNLGTNWTSADGGPEATLRLQKGRGPQRAGEVAIDSVTASKGHFEVGDTAKVLLRGPAAEQQVVGIFTFGSTGNLAGATLTAFDTATAQRVLLEPGFFSSVKATADEGVSQQTLARRVRAAVPERYEAITGEQLSQENTDAVTEGLGFVNIFLLVFAGIALFVGSFIILNTFSMLVAQRTRELALLRAVGASRSQVTRSVLGEALAVGVVGATLGLGLGFLLAVGLRALFSAVGIELPTGPLAFEASTAVWAYVIGVGVTLVAAYAPARRASKVAPVAALRDDVAMPAVSLRRRSIAGASLLLLGAGAITAGFLGSGGSGAALVGVGALVVFIGVAAMSPLLSRPVVRLVGAPFPRLFGTAGKLSQENALRNPRRTAATASALMIGLALIATMTILGASTKASVSDLVDKSLGADYVLSTDAYLPFSTDVAKTLEGTAGVQAVGVLRWGRVQIDGKGAQVIGVTPAAAEPMMRLQLTSGSTAGLSAGGLLVDEKQARVQGWKIRDSVPVQFARTGTRRLPLAGVYKENQLAGPYLVSLDTYERNFTQVLDNVVLVTGEDGADGTTVTRAIESSVQPFPNIDVKDQTEFKDEQRSQVDQIVNIIYGLLVLAVIIAVLGIVNTLALSVFERTREIGLLRAVGMSRRQLRRMIRLESVIISVFGALLGLAIGVVFGVAIQQAIKDQGITALSIPTGQLAAYVVLAAVIGVLAAVWPARRAARLDVLRAVTTD